MNNRLGKFAFIFSSVLIACAAVVYGAFLYAIPALINSPEVTEEVKNLLQEKTQTNLDIKRLHCSTYYNLSADCSIEAVTLSSNFDDKILQSDNIFVKFRPLSIYPEKITINYIFADKNQLGKIKLPQNKNKNKKQKFNLKSLPEITINKTEFIFDEKSKIILENTAVERRQNKYILKSNAEIETNYTKNKITAGNSGFLSYENDTFSAENFKINLLDSELDINGKLFDKNKQYDFLVTGTNLPVKELEEGFLFFMKQKKPDKNFIENFYDFSGRANVDLRISNDGLFGKTIVKNLYAKTVMFSVPILLPDAEFKFMGREITAEASGKLGNEDVFTDFFAKKLFTPDKIVYGSVKSELSANFTKLYTPDIRILGEIDALVKYQIKNGDAEVEYLAEIPAGSNLYFKNSDLGLTDRDRHVFAKTLKRGNKLYLKTYDYSFLNNGIPENIILGEGLFIKENGKFRMDMITCRTNGEAPVSVTGSFGKYIEGGTFSGDLTYYYPKNILTGNIALHNSKYKNFFVKEASINADESIMKIKADGTYENSPFLAFINMNNKFEDEITINKLVLRLNEYILKKDPKPQREKIKPKFALPPNSKTKDIKWTIKDGILALNKLQYNKVILEHLELTGNLKDEHIEFSMPEINFAHGILSASGSFDIKTKSSDIYFKARDIDSNIAADMIFDLKDQIEGSANAAMHLKTFNKLEQIDAHTDFWIEDGALTKIGSTEFIVKKNKGLLKIIKFKIPDIINVDINKMKALKSDINGCLDVHNHKIRNLNIFVQHKYLSLFVEGNYNIKKQDTNLQLWGKYNRNTQKGIRILFVPLSVITKILFRPEYTKELYQDKIDMVPSISAKSGEEEDFTVRMTGNLNDNSSIKVEFKSIR